MSTRLGSIVVAVRAEKESTNLETLVCRKVSDYVCRSLKMCGAMLFHKIFDDRSHMFVYNKRRMWKDTGYDLLGCPCGLFVWKDARLLKKTQLNDMPFSKCYGQTMYCHRLRNRIGSVAEGKVSTVVNPVMQIPGMTCPSLYKFL